MKKILISGGFGAGWSTWTYGGKEEEEFALFYQPLIDFLESDDHNNTAKFKEVLAQFSTDYEEKFGKTPYIGGADGLYVAEVDGPFRIHEYDGAESLHTEESDRMEYHNG